MRCLGLWLGGWLTLAASLANAGELIQLERLVKSSHWSAISRLIAYDDRLWYVNSEPYRDFNAADVYSYDPAAGVSRYERQLFSQDAGEPVVSQGLLYWPFEDPRFSAGRGEYMRTDGTVWQWRHIPRALSFHAHAMANCGNTLLAGSGAWSGGIQSSRDQGHTWRADYFHPTPDQRVSRVLSFATLSARCYAAIRAFGQPSAKLVEWQAGEIIPVPGTDEWPGIRTLATHNNTLYGVLMRAENPTLVRFDGERIDAIPGPPGGVLISIASAPQGLLAITADQTSGALWLLKDEHWHEQFVFADSAPADLLVWEGAVFVSTFARPGGELWGPPIGRRLVSVPRARIVQQQDVDDSPAARRAKLSSLFDELDRALLTPSAFDRIATELRRILADIIRVGGLAAGSGLSNRLTVPVASRAVPTFASPKPIPASDIARHYLLRAIGLIGYGHVPVSMLELDWKEPENGPAKYFHPLPGAIWVVGVLKQNDRATLEALVARLDNQRDPRWLKGDVIGTLTAITGQRYGYQVARWRALSAAGKARFQPLQE